MSVRLIAAVAVVIVMVGAPVGAADSDLWVSIQGPLEIHPDRTVFYVVHYGNRGPDDADSAFLEVDLPAGVPARFDELDDDDRFVIESRMAGTDTLGNVPHLVDAATCDHLVVRLEGPARPGPDTLVGLTAGAAGSFRIGISGPRWSPQPVQLTIETPAALAGAVTHLGRGTCGSCTPYWPRCAFTAGDYLTSFAQRPAQLAGPGGAYACAPLPIDATGTVIVAREGSCDAATKNRQARNAGALAMVLVSDGICAGEPSGNDCVDELTGPLAEPGSLEQIPMVMVSRSIGEALIASLTDGDQVSLSLGQVPTLSAPVTARIFTAPDSSGRDPSPGDDTSVFTTLFRPPTADLWVELDGPATAAYGEPVTYTVRYGNRGPDVADAAFVALELPPGVPERYIDLAQPDLDALAAAADLSGVHGGIVRVVGSDRCDTAVVRLEGAESTIWTAAPVPPLVPGDGGSFSFTTSFPMSLPRRAGLRVDSPTDLAREITVLGRGTCDWCQPGDRACTGEPLNGSFADHALAMIADDGSADPTLGCDLPIPDYTGSVVLIRRGGCEFGNKLLHAQLGGAVGAVLVNSGHCLSIQDPGCVIDFRDGDWTYSELPTVMVTQLDGEALIAAVEAGREVRLSLGGFPTHDGRVTARTWQDDADVEHLDPVPTDAIAVHLTVVNAPAPGGPVRRTGPRLGRRMP